MNLLLVREVIEYMLMPVFKEIRNLLNREGLVIGDINMPHLLCLDLY